MLEPRQLMSVSLVKDIVSGSGTSNPTNLTAVGDMGYFVATDTEHGTELWKSDGTAAGTVRVNGVSAANLRELTGSGTNLFFVATDGYGGNRQLWKSDGTAAGTVALSDLPTPDSGQLTAAGGLVYFV